MLYFSNKAHHVITEDAMHILIANINLIFDSASKKVEKIMGSHLQLPIITPYYICSNYKF